MPNVRIKIIQMRVRCFVLGHTLTLAPATIKKEVQGSTRVSAKIYRGKVCVMQETPGGTKSRLQHFEAIVKQMPAFLNERNYSRPTVDVNERKGEKLRERR